MTERKKRGADKKPRKPISAWPWAADFATPNPLNVPCPHCGSIYRTIRWGVGTICASCKRNPHIATAYPTWLSFDGDSGSEGYQTP